MVRRDPGTPRAIRAQVAEQRIRCRTALQAAQVAPLPGVVAVAEDGGRLLIRSTQAEATLRALMALDADLAEIEVARATLEQALDQLISREAA